MVAVPAGGGKTVLLRSWISQEGLAGRAAWVAAGREEQDPRWFWLSVVGALRRTTAGAGLVRAVSAAPDLDGWAVTERLLTDLAPLPDRLWLEGELAEIRAEDLKLTVAEAGELFAAAGVELPGPERVGGELADLLAGDEGAERVLQDLETANAFVVSLNADRSWFRYHQLFAGLLQLELRRTAPGEVAGLHQAAAAWVRRAPAPGGGDPARPGRPRLGRSRPSARRSLAWPAPGRAGRDCP